MIAIGSHDLIVALSEPRTGRYGRCRYLQPCGWNPAGIGSALFAATRKAAVAAGRAAINAMIHADNAGGLAYYTRIGFRNHGVERAVPLRDGTQIDRIVKRFDLA